MHATRSLLIAILLLILLPIATMAAPITRTVADRFEVTIGYLQEPAILGDTNGVRLKITDNGEPVTDVIDDVLVQVEFMDAVRALNMVESSEEPGVYTGVFIPMQTGEFNFRITGAIDGVNIDEAFTVADGLVSVTPRSDYEFPNAANGSTIQELAVPIAATAIVGAVILAATRRSRTAN